MNRKPTTDAKGPAPGTEVNGYVFKGGNPNDKANWEKTGTAAAAAAAPAPAPAKRPLGEDTSPAAQAVAQAKQDVRAAEAALQRYGSVQRQNDPRGFEKAQWALEAAKRSEREATEAYVSGVER